MNDLSKPLNDLNDWLKQQAISIDLIVIGAFAINLHGIKNRMTMDIDTIVSIEDPKILKKIYEIGRKYGLPSWLNDQAENLIMPPNYEQRLLHDHSYSHINLSYISRIDLIFLKVAAYFYRGDTDPKDKEDLALIKCTFSELDLAINFLGNFHKPDTKSFLKSFYERIKEITTELKDVCSK